LIFQISKFINLYNDFNSRIKNEIIKPFIERDKSDNPFSHTNICDVKYCAVWRSKEDEEAIFNMFRKIKKSDTETRKKLINKFYSILERKYNDQTLLEDEPQPEKVGRVVDKVVSNGIQTIGLWATGTSFQIYPWMIAGTSTATVLYGDTQTNITELARVNVVTTNGFLDPTVDGWTASGGFARSTISGTVAEIAMGNTNSNSTSLIFDRSLLPFADRIPHVQNQDSFTLSSIYVLTSI
jgi:hypothetical protein